MFRRILKIQSLRNFSSSSQNVKVQNVQISSASSHYELDQTSIDEAIKAAPVLSAASPALWQRSHEVFTNHGIKTTNFLQMIVGNPALLSRHPHKIVDGFESWRSCQFGEKYFHQLITKYPTLLDVSDGRELVIRITFLRGFVGSTKNVWKLLMNCPNLVNDSEQSIVKRFEYLTETMRIEVPEIAKSEALAKPLDEIKCRHVFLERLGLFKPRSPKADPNEPSKNPRLYQITDSSTKSFATKVAQVTVPEFEAFQELFKRELDRRKEQSMEDDEDDEEYEDDNESRN